MTKMNNKLIKSKVLEALNHTNELRFPVNIKCIVKSYENIRLIPYSTEMEKRSLTYQEMLKFAGSKDAVTFYYAGPDVYVIFYNDCDERIMTSLRYRWNIAHELGHILLNHLRDYKQSCIWRSSLSDTTYKTLEDEADKFAAYMLVPHSVLYHLNVRTYYDIENYCCVSSLAAKNRIQDYRKWLHDGFFSDGYDFKVEDLFYNSVCEMFGDIEGFIPAKLYRKARCRSCGFKFHTRRTLSSMFCPSCGEKTVISTKEDIDVKYKGIELKVNQKVKECPRCKNDEFDDLDNFCRICGEPLINSCNNANCENYSLPQPGNARYCPVCGQETSFKTKGFLLDWDDPSEYDSKTSREIDVFDLIDNEFKTTPSFDETDAPF